MLEHATRRRSSAAPWRRIKPRRLSLLVIALAACLVALLATLVVPMPALRAWLAAAVLWTAWPIGALAILMMVRLIPGEWGAELTLPLETAVLLLPLAAIMFVPVLLGMGVLYEWTGQEQPTAFRSVYLSEWFFVLRTAVWFAILIALGILLLARRTWSTPIACIGLIVFAVFGTFIATDWLMSLEPEFHSSGFGLYLISIQMTFALAAAIVIALATGGAGVRRPQVLGGLLLTALLLWIYFAFMQFVIIWSADFPEEASWYLRRVAGGWSTVLWAIAILHGVPTFLLMLPPVLRSRAALIALAGAVMLGKALEAAWLVLPARGIETGWSGGLLFVVATIGLGALFIAASLSALDTRVAARAPNPP